MLCGLALHASSRRIAQFDFRWSMGGFREDEIIESVVSSPARFLLEVGRRILKADPTADYVVAGNPLLPLKAAQLANWLAEVIPGPAVALSPDGFPMAYILPRTVFTEDERFLLLLSCMDGELDRRFLKRLLGSRPPQVFLPVPQLGKYPRAGANGWMNMDDRMKSPTKTTLAAIYQMDRNPNWRQSPFAAYHPYHTGDIVLFSTGARMAKPLLYQKQIVCWSYRDIPAACDSPLETVTLRLPIMPRDGSVGKYDYFKQALTRLGEPFLAENFVVFARFMRSLFPSPFHIADHARFALGDPLDEYSRTVQATGTCKAQRCALPPKPLKVLLHLDGGWSLKTYPKDGTRSLISGLVGLGCQVSVLDRPDLAELGAVPLVSGNTADLKAQIADHHIFVGTDSFPQNVVNNVMGWPCVGLFGNTRQGNADARYDAGQYRSECNLLPCNRCGGMDLCPLFNRPDCINFSPAEVVLADVADLARRAYGVTL